MRNRTPSVAVKIIEGKIVKIHFEASHLTRDSNSVVHFSLEGGSCLSNVNFHWRKSREQRENVLRFQFFNFSYNFFTDHYQVSIMKPNHALSMTNASRLYTSGQVSFVCDEISALIQAN